MKIFSTFCFSVLLLFSSTVISAADFEAALSSETAQFKLRSDSSVIAQIQNNLSATTLNNGEQAWIEKKAAGVGLIVNPVPVPAAVWLFGSALALLGWIRRRTA